MTWWGTGTETMSNGRPSTFWLLVHWIIVCLKGNFSPHSQVLWWLYQSWPNVKPEPSTFEVRNELFAPDGKLLQTFKKKVTLKAGETRRMELQSKLISNPELWTPETLILYKVVTSLVDTKTRKAIDEKSHKVGFRWFSFDGEKGFCLNGKSYKLRGFNRHQDQAPVGVAPHRRDIRLLKEMGSNYIRIYQYPQDDALLDTCDELGLLAWEEIPIIDLVPDTPGYADNCERNLREMIR